MYELRAYQKDAVSQTIKYFQKRRLPAVIVLPTGAGKSLVIAELAKLALGRVLVLAHVKELVEQNHEKFESYGLQAGIYSAGLNKKDSTHKVIFGSIQSVARADDDFFENFSLLVIDECHRVGLEPDTQYRTVIDKLKKLNPELCVLGLTATPYRLGLGWIYNFDSEGTTQTNESRFFSQCIFELPLEFMIKNKYLTPPVKVDIPVTCYDFSELVQDGQKFKIKEIERLLKEQRSLTPLIVKNIIDITEVYKRQGVMIFCSTIKHAKEIMACLPTDQARLVIGDTESSERYSIIDSFKKREFKYLVNVSVLTTGFDAPPVDVIAILRPTESVSLYQQIIGRGLRLSDSKKDCYVLDYAGMGHNIYRPSVKDKRPKPESITVKVTCPKCHFDNSFWGIKNLDGEVVEHFGRTCRGGLKDPLSFKVKPCGYRFRFKICDKCAHQNDLMAKVCEKCSNEIIDTDAKLKQAKLSKDAHVLTPETVLIDCAYDKDGQEFLEIKYYDYNGEFLREIHYLDEPIDRQKFEINFLRSHKKIPEYNFKFTSAKDIINAQNLFRQPAFVIGRKKGKEWRITEKIFAESLGKIKPQFE
jgi:DNA repair protein RadD